MLDSTLGVGLKESLKSLPSLSFGYDTFRRHITTCKFSLATGGFTSFLVYDSDTGSHLGMDELLKSLPSLSLVMRPFCSTSPNVTSS